MIFGPFSHTNDNILSRMVVTGSKMNRQPTSKSRLADGIADVVNYRRIGIPQAVGLDDQSCTDVSDPLQNICMGSDVMKGLYKNAKALFVQDMLYFHTPGNVGVLEIDEQVGRLVLGNSLTLLS